MGERWVVGRRTVASPFPSIPALHLPSFDSRSRRRLGDVCGRVNQPPRLSQRINSEFSAFLSRCESKAHGRGDGNSGAEPRGRPAITIYFSTTNFFRPQWRVWFRNFAARQFSEKKKKSAHRFQTLLSGILCLQKGVIISHLLFSFFNMARGEKKSGAHNRKKK